MNAFKKASIWLLAIVLIAFAGAAGYKVADAQAAQREIALLQSIETHDKNLSVVENQASSLRSP